MKKTTYGMRYLQLLDNFMLKNVIFFDWKDTDGVRLVG